MTQNARLLNWLETRGPITRLEAARDLGIMNLWQRIAELEGLGYVIDHEDQVEVQDRFGNKCRVTRYRLISLPAAQASDTPQRVVSGCASVASRLDAAAHLPATAVSNPTTEASTLDEASGALSAAAPQLVTCYYIDKNGKERSYQVTA